MVEGWQGMRDRSGAVAGFNLAEQAWLDVVLTDGRRDTYSTVEVLRSASSVAGLDVSDPLTRSAVLQHLLALVYTTVGAPTVVDLQSGVTPDLDEVAGWVEVNSSRFDLFDPVRPFAQNPRLVDVAGEARVVGPAHGLLWESAKRRAPLKAALTFADEVALLPAAAAQLLIARQAFSLGGLWPFPRKTALWGPSVYSWPDSARWGAPIAHLSGATLADTLRLNWVPGTAGQVNLSWADHHDGAGSGSPWPGGKPPERTPSGIADVSTWLSRNVLLLRDEDGLVRRMVLTAGDKLTAPDRSVMPHALYTERGVVRMLPPQVGRRPWRLWRSLAEALPRAASSSGTEDGLLGYHALRGDPCPVRLDVTGMSATPSGPMYAALHESVLLPPADRWAAIGVTLTEVTAAARKTGWITASRACKVDAPSGQVPPGMLTGLDRDLDRAAVDLLEQTLTPAAFNAAIAAALTESAQQISTRFAITGQWEASAATSAPSSRKRTKA